MATSRSSNFPKSMWPDHILLVVRQQQSLGTFADENVEVIEPEIGHHFLELALAVDRAHQLGLGQLLDDHSGGIFMASRVSFCFGFMPATNSCPPAPRRDSAKMIFSSGDSDMTFL